MVKIIPFVSRGSPSENEDWLTSLRSAITDASIKPLADLDQSALESAEVAIVADPDPSDLAKLPNLVWVQSLWAGVEKMMAELKTSDLQVVRLEDPQMAKTMTEAVLAWTLYLHRDMPLYRAQQEKRLWQNHPLKLPQERTIGFLGLGHLGGTAARKLREQDFNVIGWSRSGAPVEGVHVFHGVDGLKSVLRGADIIVVLVPLTPDTRGLLSHETLSHVRTGSSLINFARGPIIDDEALLAALDSGRINHAVLDVFQSEPLPEDSAYWSHPSVTVLPHISAPTTRATAAAIAASNIAEYFRSGVVPASVDHKRGY